MRQFSPINNAGSAKQLAKRREELRGRAVNVSAQLIHEGGRIFNEAPSLAYLDDKLKASEPSSYSSANLDFPSEISVDGEVDNFDSQHIANGDIEKNNALEISLTPPANFLEYPSQSSSSDKSDIDYERLSINESLLRFDGVESPRARESSQSSPRQNGESLIDHTQTSLKDFGLSTDLKVICYEELEERAREKLKFKSIPVDELSKNIDELKSRIEFLKKIKKFRIFNPTPSKIKKNDEVINVEPIFDLTRNEFYFNVPVISNNKLQLNQQKKIIYNQHAMNDLLIKVSDSNMVKKSQCYKLIFEFNCEKNQYTPYAVPINHEKTDADKVMFIFFDNQKKEEVKILVKPNINKSELPTGLVFSPIKSENYCSDRKVR